MGVCFDMGRFLGTANANGTSARRKIHVEIACGHDSKDFGIRDFSGGAALIYRLTCASDPYKRSRNEWMDEWMDEYDAWWQ